MNIVSVHLISPILYSVCIYLAHCNDTEGEKARHPQSTKTIFITEREKKSSHQSVYLRSYWPIHLQNWTGDVEMTAPSATPNFPGLLIWRQICPQQVSWLLSVKGIQQPSAQVSLHYNAINREKMIIALWDLYRLLPPMSSGYNKAWSVATEKSSFCRSWLKAKTKIVHLENKTFLFVSVLCIAP